MDNFFPLRLGDRWSTASPKRSHQIELDTKRDAVREIEPRSGEHHGLAVQRPAIRSYSFPTEPLFHEQASRFVEAHTSPLHDDIDLALGLLVQSMPRVARFDVLGQIEGGAVQAGFGVAGEGCGESGVAGLVYVVLDGVGEVVGPVGDCAGGCEVGDWGSVWLPDVAGGVEDCTWSAD